GQVSRDVGPGRVASQEAARGEGSKEEEDRRDIEDDENQREHVVLKVELDLRLALGDLAAFVRQVLQRRRMVRAKQPRGEERAQGEKQRDDGENDHGDVAHQRTLRGVGKMEAY